MTAELAVATRRPRRPRASIGGVQKHRAAPRMRLSCAPSLYHSRVGFMLSRSLRCSLPGRKPGRRGCTSVTGGGWRTAGVPESQPRSSALPGPSAHRRVSAHPTCTSTTRPARAPLWLLGRGTLPRRAAVRRRPFSALALAARAGLVAAPEGVRMRSVRCAMCDVRCAMVPVSVVRHVHSLLTICPC